MDSLIHAFGIDIKLITIQIINFVVLAGALSYLLYKPVLRILSEREEKIKQGVADAESAKNAKLAADEDRKAIVESAHKEAEAVSKRAEEHAQEKAGQIMTNAEKEAAQALKIAADKAEALKETARKESEAEIAKLAVLATEKMLKKEL